MPKHAPAEHRSQNLQFPKLGAAPHAVQMWWWRKKMREDPPGEEARAHEGSVHPRTHTFKSESLLQPLLVRAGRLGAVL